MLYHLGFKRERRDFENEFDPELDVVLSDVEYFTDDTPEDIEFKDKQI